MKRLFGIVTCLVVLVLIPACGDSGDETTINNGTPAAAGPAFVALSENGGFLLTFQAGAPETITSITQIRGIVDVVSETLVGIAYRPATGQLYGLSVDGGGIVRLYTIDRSTGTAALVGSMPAPLLNGNAHYGIAFNPVADRLRVMNSLNENLRINPDTGALAADDTNLTFAAGATGPIVAAAYSNNFAGATATTLYAIDAGTAALALIGGIDGNPSPNGGIASVVARPLGLSVINTRVSFVITPTGVAYLTQSAIGGAGASLSLVNLTTGQSIRIGTVGGFTALRSLAVIP